MTTEDLTRIERRLKPHKGIQTHPEDLDLNSNIGFLGRHERFKTVIRRQKQLLDKHGVSPEAIGQRLRDLMEGKKFENINFTFPRVRCLGSQSCPWGCGAVGSGTYAVRNTRTGELLEFEQLHPHLIEAHHFFEGETPYGLDLEKVLRVLELVPVDKRPRKTTPVWQIVKTLFYLGNERFKTIKEEREWIRQKLKELHPEHATLVEAKPYLVSKGVHAYLKGNYGLIVPTQTILTGKHPQINGTKIYPWCNLMHGGFVFVIEKKRHHGKSFRIFTIWTTGPKKYNLIY